MLSSKRRRARRKVLTYFGFGEPACPGQNQELYRTMTLDDVTGRNDGWVRIDTRWLGIGTDRTAFLQELAARNGGTFSKLGE